MLESTMVVWVGEFGRTPKISSNGGRDHWPQCYCAMVAGGGVESGIRSRRVGQTRRVPGFSGQVRPRRPGGDDAARRSGVAPDVGDHAMRSGRPLPGVARHADRGDFGVTARLSRGPPASGGDRRNL